MATLDVSPNDDRSYRLITLDNGLRALLASDPTAEHGAAAMAVNVGAAHDPTGLPGLAHFCEHMLFLGSEKYKEESAYKKFLAAHGGRSNASTSMEHTVYKFEVLAAHLQEALDIFAQFFIAPLFTASATERELNAVDSEDARNRTVDGRRLLQVLKAAADVPHHPWAKFSTGNSTTLRGGGDATRSALLDFHGLHYVASRMALVVLGAGDSLDILEATVRQTFAAVPSAPRVPAGEAADALHVAAEAAAPPRPDAFESPFASGCLPRVLHVSPLKELRELCLLWPAPAVRHRYRSDPSHLCSHLLGHEGEGSALSALQDLGWATALSAGLRCNDARFSLFQVKITLTVAGEASWRRVVSLVDSHCALLRAMGDREMQRHWAECVSMRRLGFEFLEKSAPYDWAAAHAARLLNHKPHHVLSAGYVMDEELEPSATRAWIRQLNLDNMVVLVACQSAPPMLPPAKQQDAVLRRSRLAAKNAPPWQSLMRPVCGPECCSADVGLHEATEEWYGVTFRCAPLPPLLEVAAAAATSSPTEREGRVREVKDEAAGETAAPTSSAVDSSAAFERACDSLCLPPPNPFIPTDLALRAKRSLPLDALPPPPACLLDHCKHSDDAAAATAAVWHAPDRRLGVPRVDIRLFLFAFRMCGPERTLASLHGQLLTQLLKRRVYEAEVAGLYASVGIGPRGAYLHVSGYSQHAPRLLRLVLSTLLHGATELAGAETAFAAVKERAQRRLRSSKLESPGYQAEHWMELLLGAGEYRSIEAELEDVAAASLDAIGELHRKWRAQLSCALLLCGNVTAAEALACHRDVVLAELRKHSVAPLPPALRAPRPRGRLPPGGRLELHSRVGSDAEKNSCCTVYLEAGVLDESEQAALRVLCSLLREPW